MAFLQALPRMAHGRLAQLRQELRDDFAMLAGQSQGLAGGDMGEGDG